MNSNQAKDDFSTFSAPDPEVLEARKKEEAEKKKKAAKADAALRPEQLKAAEKFGQQIKEQKEKEVNGPEHKAYLIETLADLRAHILKYKGEEVLASLRSPKNFGAKNSVEELEVWIAEARRILDSGTAQQTVFMIWREGSKAIEAGFKDNEWGIMFDGLGEVAAQSLMPRRTAEGVVLPGPAEPTLAELALKYKHWFSASVEVRAVLMFAEMLVTVHRINAQKALNVQEAATTKVSEETASKLNKL